MDSRVYAEIVRLERAALARGPRTRDGLGDFNWRRAPPDQWSWEAYALAAGAGVAGLVVGGIAGVGTKSWKTGLGAGIGTLAVGVIAVGVRSAYVPNTSGAVLPTTRGV